MWGGLSRHYPSQTHQRSGISSLQREMCQMVPRMHGVHYTRLLHILQDGLTSTQSLDIMVLPESILQEAHQYLAENEGKCNWPGCAHQCCLLHLWKHEVSCPRRIVTCPWPGCTIKKAVQDMGHHVKHCKYSIHPCPWEGCGQSVLLEMREAYPSVPLAPDFLPHHPCKVRMCPSMLQSHLAVCEHTPCHVRGNGHSVHDSCPAMPRCARTARGVHLGRFTHTSLSRRNSCAGM